MAGMTLMIRRIADVASDGSVLPRAWNMLDDTNVTPEATKFSTTIRKYSTPTEVTSASLVKMRISGSAAKNIATAVTNIEPAAIPAAALNAARTRSPFFAAKFWPATGATANPSATHGRKTD